MIIANRSIHIIDYENNRILSRDIPATFDEYVGELIEHINRNDSVRDYKTRSRYTEVISGAIAISSQKDNADVVRERTMMIFQCHANLKYKFGNQNFWSTGYYMSTIGIQEMALRKYIQGQ